MKAAIIQGRTYLGIELGSTRIKAVLVNDTCEQLASGLYDWENQLIAGYWTYSQDEIINGLQKAYARLAMEVKNRHGVLLTRVAAIGCSAMMQGYIAVDKTGKLLVPFRTWRNMTTAAAAAQLTERFQFKIPQRWSIAHLFQAVLNREEHVAQIDYVTTLAGYIHWRLTGERYLGIGDASGMFPVDLTKRKFDENKLAVFDNLIAQREYSWNLIDILPTIRVAGEPAGHLSVEGAQLLDPSGTLEAGIAMCPPEGDGGTGTVATNSVNIRAGNISVGTSIFAQFVLEKELSKIYPEIDIMATPDGKPVGIILANNCSGDINAWVNLFREFYQAMGLVPDMDRIYETLFNKAMDAEPDGGALLSYGYYSAESITGVDVGRPLFVRCPESRFNLSNFMRTHLFSAFAALRLGMDMLTNGEHIRIEQIKAHGGLFKTRLPAQKICAAALDTPVSVMATAGEAGAWGMAVLASFMVNRKDAETLSSYLSDRVFVRLEEQIVDPEPRDVEGFTVFMNRYKQGLAIERTAGEYFMEDNLSDG